MPITELHVAGYRSIRDVFLRLGPVNVIVGPNGCGKTNLYRSLGFVAAAAQGRFARELVAEGGMPSALWAGARGKGPVRMVLSVTVDEFTYELQCGLPQTVTPTRFVLDPEIKEEHVWFRDGKRRTELLHRAAGTVWARDDQGARAVFPMALGPSDVALSELREPHRFPVLSSLREEFLSWRFHHQFRTDRDSPLRRPRPGCRTPVLDPDGYEVAAALQTIVEIGDAGALNAFLDQAFPGSRLRIGGDEGPGVSGLFELGLESPGFGRPFRAGELSDGTLQFLCLLAALLSPRPPSLLGLNEPETSIHPDLLDPLARLIVRAGQASQLWITTHSEPLSRRIEELAGITPIRLEKLGGETRLAARD